MSDTDKYIFKVGEKEKEKTNVIEYKLPNSTQKEINTALTGSQNDTQESTLSASKLTLVVPLLLFLLHSIHSYENKNKSDTNYKEDFFTNYYEKIERVKEKQKKCPKLNHKELLELEKVEKTIFNHHSDGERESELSKIYQLPFANKISTINIPHEASEYVVKNINKEICSCIGIITVNIDSIKNTIDLQRDRNILKSNINNPNFIVDYQNLIYLNLSYILIDEDYFPYEVLTLKSLETLQLEHNDISFVPEEIDMLNNLRTLSLKDNKLKSLPNKVKNLENLESLDISYNTILPESIPGGFKQLKKLNLSYNNLTEVPSIIRANKELEEIILSNNSIKTIERFKKEELPKSIRTIDLRNNTISNGKKKIPSLNTKDSNRIQKQFKKGIVKF